MASWNIPALINKISEDVPAIKALLTALFKWTDAGTEDVPEGAKRLQSVTGGRQIQEYSGSSWGSVGKLMHDVDMLDGKHASTAQTPDTIPVRDANGSIPGNITGNATTATTASSVSSEYVVPIANGGTGATSAANARTNLGTNNAENITQGILATARGGTGRNDGKVTDVFLTDYQTGAVGLGQLGPAVTKNAVDCDSLTKQGVYGCTNCTVALKYPTEGNFFVEVFQNGNYILQRASQYGINNTYIRRSTNGGASWTGWTPDDVNSGGNFHIYVSKGGSDVNSGLTADNPVQTLGRAIAIAKGVKADAGIILHVGPGEWGDLWIRNGYLQAQCLKITNYPNSDVSSVADFNSLTGSDNTGNQPPHFTKIENDSTGYFILGNVSVDFLNLNSMHLGNSGVSSISRCNLYNCWAGFGAHIVRKTNTTEPVFYLEHSYLYIGGAAHSFVNSPTNRAYIATNDNCSVAIDGRATWSGTFPGKKYDFNSLCTIPNGFIAPTDWPGAINGTGSYYCTKLVIETNTSDKINFNNPEAIRGTTPSGGGLWDQMIFYDKNKNALACIEHGYTDAGDNRIALLAMDPTKTNWDHAQMGIGYHASGSWYTYTPTPAAADNSDMIANTNWVRNATGNTNLNAANVHGVVGLANGGTGANTRLGALRSLTSERMTVSNSLWFLTINDNWVNGGHLSVGEARTLLNCLLLSGGTMTGPLNVKFGSANVCLQNTDLTKGTAPNDVKYTFINLCDKNGGAFAANTLGQLEIRVEANNSVHTYIRALKNEANSTACCEIACVYDTANNRAYTRTVTPAADSNTTEIATTAWVRGRLSGSEYSMVPSANPEGRSVGATYTAGTNGFFKVETNTIGDYWAGVWINGHESRVHIGEYGSGGNWSGNLVFIPVKKGWTYSCYSCSWCGFQPC